ncbi:MAG TPA: hypothetical protein VKW08_04350 [Xanthobacteraceae bacterium]|nr:hypothetical protein [Xanthobacteraceae bacterium]
MRAQAEGTVEDATAPTHSRPRLLPFAAAGATLLLGATAALWAYYGTAVFYETILAGIAACM